MSPLSILIACEKSGVVRDAFIARGHHAMSCDIEPTEAPGPHYQGDVRDVLCAPWDILIAHPECTYLSGSGWHWVTRGRIEADGDLTELDAETLAALRGEIARIDGTVDAAVYFANQGA